MSKLWPSVILLLLHLFLEGWSIFFFYYILNREFYGRVISVSAESILLAQIFEEDVASPYGRPLYFVNKKIKYVWDEQSNSFTKLRWSLTILKWIKKKRYTERTARKSERPVAEKCQEMPESLPEGYTRLLSNEQVMPVSASSTYFHSKMKYVRSIIEKFIVELNSGDNHPQIQRQ